MNAPPLTDRVKDQEIYARCLVSGDYEEGTLYKEQTFRVGYGSDGEKLLRHPYPAVRMEFLRSRGEAERVVGGTITATPAVDTSAAIQEIRAARASRRKEAKDVGPLSDADGGANEVPGNQGRLETPPGD